MVKSSKCCIKKASVILNRGINNDLRRPAPNLPCYTQFGSRAKIKGTIQITEVEPSVAIARIENETDRNAPIIPGDHIHNPVYNPFDAKIFVVKGNFETYSRDELRHFIRDAGNRVAETITPQTDFLVAGQDAGDAIDAAGDNGVTILSEDSVDGIYSPRPTSNRHNWPDLCSLPVVLTADEKLAKQYIEESGGVIEDRINKNTQVVIVGAGAENDSQRARAVGVDYFGARAAQNHCQRGGDPMNAARRGNAQTTTMAALDRCLPPDHYGRVHGL